MLERRPDRSKRYRKRRAAGRIVIRLEVGPELVELLVRTRYLLPSCACHGRPEIAAALERMLSDAARE